MNGEGESGKSLLAAQHDGEDGDVIMNIINILLYKVMLHNILLNILLASSSLSSAFDRHKVEIFVNVSIFNAEG